jgi:hypothetical protein
VPAKKRLLKYKELASRLNGVQIPIFGVQWAPTEPERYSPDASTLVVPSTVIETTWPCRSKP